MEYDEIFGQTLVRPPWEYIHMMRTVSLPAERAVFIQQAIDEHNWVFIDGLRRVMDPYVRLDNIQVPIKDSTYHTGYTWEQFNKLADKVYTGEITRILRTELIAEAMEYSHKTVWNEWFRPILTKNIRMGIYYDKFNRILKRNNLKPIQTFHPQQCYEVQSKPKRIPGDKIVDFKPNGKRLAILARPDGECVGFAQNGRVVTMYTNLFIEYENFAKHFLKQPVVFDGDVLSEEYYDLREKGYDTSQMRLTDAVHYVYDIIPWDQYVKRSFDQPLDHRRRILETNIAAAHEHGYLTSVRMIKYRRMTLDPATGENIDQLYEFLQEAVDWGHEGLMIKNPTKPYKCSRSSDWLKLRPKVNVVLTIDSIRLYSDKKRLYSIQCSGDHEDQFIKVNVARGITHESQRYILENRVDLIGKHIEVAGGYILYSEIKGHYTLETPSFIRLRPDLDPENII